jgi:hypothetical protein
MPRTPRNPGTGKAPHNGNANGPGMGAGWGGPANGASTSRLAGAGDAYSDAIRALAADPRHAASKVPLRELVFRTWVEVAAGGESESARVVAAEKLMDRLDGKATQRSEVTGADAGPLEIVRRIVDPKAE